MSKIKLIGLDLDGTLFNDKKEISGRNREAIEQAAALGVFIVPATGRPFVGLQPSVRSLPIKYALTANGAAVYEAATGKRLYEACIPEEKAVSILSMLREYDVMEDCFIDGYGYGEKEKLEKSDSYAMPEVVRAYMMATRKQVNSLLEYIREKHCMVEKITVNFKEKNGILLWEQEIKERLFREFPEYAVVKGVPTNLEITHGTATKGAAILKLGELLGISREEIMVCGDSQNDLDMIKAAGIGIAMGNAIPEVKAVADYITLSNEEDGVAKAIEKFVIGDKNADEGF